MTKSKTLTPPLGQHATAIKHLATSVTAVILLSGCSLLQQKNEVGVVDAEPEAVKTSLTKRSYDPNDRIEDHIYIGAGLGLSHLNPDASQSSTFDVNDRVQNAGLFNVGMDLSRQVSIDLQAVSLGSAGFSPAGSIDYREYSGSALFYVGKNRHRYKRRGLSAYGRIGGGYLQNKTNGVPYRKENGFHFLIGAGAEFMTKSGLGVRAEFISYEEDINYGQLGLIYRFGRQEEQERIETVAAPIPEPIPEPEPVVVVEPEPLPEPVPNIQAAIARDACLELNGVLDGVNFRTNSDELTDTSVQLLSNLANTLADCESTNITVSAHTDSQGAEAYNEALSQRRADSVVRFFNGRGIETDRMTSIAFGERSPIADNSTRDGRAQNRRVELSISE